MRKKHQKSKPKQDFSELDPNGGYICMVVHWKPDPMKPLDPMPGQKQNLFSYMPANPRYPCLCGSGQAYADCCRAKPYWYPICPDAGWDGTNFSIVSKQIVTFQNVNGPVLRERLMQSEALHCTEDNPDRSFWIYWGSPAIKDSRGFL